MMVMKKLNDQMKRNDKKGSTKIKDKDSLPFNEKTDKIKSPEPNKKLRVISKKKLHEISVSKPAMGNNKLNAIIEEENGVREAIRKGTHKR